MAVFYNNYIKLPLKRAREFLFAPKYDINEGINVLGAKCLTVEEFQEEAYTRPFLSFRTNFRASKSHRTTDTGFGCMIRSGSMLVAEALQRSMFGTHFKLDPEFSKKCPRQIWMASLFNEEMKSDTRHFHPFSIQHLMELGELKFGKREGEWFAPGTIAQVYQHVISNYCEEQLNMSIYLCRPGFNTIYEVYIFFSLIII